jgi:hypothetical protein
MEVDLMTWAYEEKVRKRGSEKAVFYLQANTEQTSPPTLCNSTTATVLKYASK